MNFEGNLQVLKANLFEYMADNFYNSKWEKDKSDLEKMYHLSAIVLKKGNAEWWIILEPIFDVPSIFNFLPRFTVRKGEIIWSNLQ